LIGIFIIRPEGNSQESYTESRDDIKRTVKRTVMRPHKIDETFPIWRPLHVSFARGLGSNALGVVRDNLDVELALVRRVKEKKQLVQGRWVEVRRRSVNLYKVSKNLLYLIRVGNNGEYFHGRAAFDTLEWIYLVYLGNQPCPCSSALR